MLSLSGGVLSGTALYLVLSSRVATTRVEHQRALFRLQSDLETHLPVERRDKVRPLSFRVGNGDELVTRFVANLPLILKQLTYPADDTDTISTTLQFTLPSYLSSISSHIPSLPLSLSLIDFNLNLPDASSLKCRYNAFLLKTGRVVANPDFEAVLSAGHDLMK